MRVARAHGLVHDHAAVHIQAARARNGQLAAHAGADEQEIRFQARAALQNDSAAVGVLHAGVYKHAHAQPLQVRPQPL